MTMSSTAVRGTDATTSRPTLPIVRQEVRNILTQSPAFRAMEPEKRQAIANAMVKVADYIAGGEAPVSQALEDVTDPAGQTAGQRFGQAGTPAAEGGQENFTALIAGVDFPGFVSGLIKGVFQAVVDASIQQMEAYGELVANVAKSVDQFMRENVSENQARDYLVDKYPDYMELDLTGEAPRVIPKEGHDDAALPPFFDDLGLAAPVEGLDEETTETVLMPAARRHMAMDRQHMLATMVLMGINRIVVTDGSIRASVKFHLDTQDMVKRHFDNMSKFASQYEYERKNQRKSGWFTSWFSPYQTDTTAKFNMTTENETNRSEDSSAVVNMRADLTGNVDLRFRSETFPLERMADILQQNSIQEKARPGRAPAESSNTGVPPAIAAPPVGR